MILYPHNNPDLRVLVIFPIEVVRDVRLIVKRQDVLLELRGQGAVAILVLLFHDVHVVGDFHRIIV